MLVKVNRYNSYDPPAIIFSKKNKKAQMRHWNSNKSLKWIIEQNKVIIGNKLK